ncbi:hypothetical protein EYF80_060004 [Liparis tanakae]|uniref:Uncharacterized protein n=1 Tax=Liparis tanakae TaxID=230148 RepID=A0A4Z2ELS5_9TELE|nr:hypothetical protein EYF80_060004 [Liparis tanakae]
MQNANRKRKRTSERKAEKSSYCRLNVSRSSVIKALPGVSIRGRRGFPLPGYSPEADWMETVVLSSFSFCGDVLHLENLQIIWRTCRSSGEPADHLENLQII